MLFLNTIDPELYQVLSDFCSIPELADFSLVGGTSLSLQLGHRKSDDLDFFTDHSFDVRQVKEAILRYNSNVLFLSETPQGISFSLPLPGKTDDARKLDIYNWADRDIQKENEADEFAVKWTLSKEEEHEILQQDIITEEDIIEFAQKFNTHPAIIIGRLQRNKILPYSLGRQFFEPVEFV